MLDTYHPGANYLAANIYRKKRDFTNALETAGWAARDIGYRSVSYSLMGALYLMQHKYEKAIAYSKKAIQYNHYNRDAREILLIAHRKTGNKKAFEKAKAALVNISTLSHVAALESQFYGKDPYSLAPWAHMKNELPHETLLNLAIYYSQLGLLSEAKAILGDLPGNSKNRLWLAYLTHKEQPEGAKELLAQLYREDTRGVFPYKRETLKVLQWASTTLPHWKISYLLAQNYIAIGQKAKGIALLRELENLPDVATFYRFRAKMTKNGNLEERKADYAKAIQLAPKDWKVWEEAIQFLLKENDPESALAYSKKAYRSFKSNYGIGLAHAQALLENQKFNECLSILDGMRVLPYEHATGSKTIYNEAHYAIILRALEKKQFKKCLPWSRPQNYGRNIWG